ncbi:hypothetical protein [Hymenobacter cellulosivorans]|uniref:Uncharacterized protein n=1 Tax=Hymenobacter cellulosivorans TaxID=2932249 RepID=A0ABY4F405_9BACT|nr:hypothetical protein [Hymenobacter cellulosivorans]UOQ50892.1 hypothetical protein MUN80_14110 [Hymenobacter cellulosivorans]
MTLLYRNQPWMYDLLQDEPSGRYYLQVVCGTSAWYEMSLLLTAAEVAAFTQELAAGHDESLTLLAKQVMRSAPGGIAHREYRRGAAC